MAEPGLTYYDNRNKIESTLLLTQYIISPLESGKNGEDYPRLIQRIRTKTYSYVGLSKTTAKACVADKLSKYTRRFFYWQNTNGRWTLTRTLKLSYESCVASVQASKQDGGLYTVEIQVNEETDAYINSGNITNMELFFANLFGTWDYDE